MGLNGGLHAAHVGVSADRFHQPELADSRMAASGRATWKSCTLERLPLFFVDWQLPTKLGYKLAYLR